MTNNQLKLIKIQFITVGLLIAVSHGLFCYLTKQYHKLILTLLIALTAPFGSSALFYVYLKSKEDTTYIKRFIYAPNTLDIIIRGMIIAIPLMFINQITQDQKIKTLTMILFTLPHLITFLQATQNKTINKALSSIQGPVRDQRKQFPFLNHLNLPPTLLPIHNASQQPILPPNTVIDIDNPIIKEHIDKHPIAIDKTDQLFTITDLCSHINFIIINPKLITQETTDPHASIDNRFKQKPKYSIKTPLDEEEIKEFNKTHRRNNNKPITTKPITIETNTDVILQDLHINTPHLTIKTNSNSRINHSIITGDINAKESHLKIDNSRINFSTITAKEISTEETTTRYLTIESNSFKTDDCSHERITTNKIDLIYTNHISFNHIKRDQQVLFNYLIGSDDNTFIYSRISKVRIKYHIHKFKREHSDLLDYVRPTEINNEELKRILKFLGLKEDQINELEYDEERMEEDLSHMIQSYKDPMWGDIPLTSHTINERLTDHLINHIKQKVATMALKMDVGECLNI